MFALSLSWIPLAILSAVFLGLYDVAKKSSLTNNAVLPVLLSCNLVGLVCLGPALVLSIVSPDLARYSGLWVEPVSLAAHGLLVIKAAIVTLSWVFSYFAIKHLPISLASPIRASAPLFTLLGAVAVFGESPSGAQWLGILCILLAYIGFSSLGRAEGIRFERDRWVGMLFAGTLVGAVSGLYDKHLVQGARIPPLALQVWFTVYVSILQFLLVALFWWPRRRSNTPFQWRWSLVAVGTLLLLADNLYFRALALPGAMISVVSVIRRTNVVISFAVGSVLFQEQNRKRKSLALLGILVGLVLLLR